MVTLSICIPTFNRGQIVVDLVNSILKCNDNRFEVVVLDNCSTDGSFENLLSIKDPRLSVFKNDFNIGSSPNVVKSILYAKGVYSIICLDKDKILTHKISELIDFFESTNCILGRCKLFSNNISKNIEYAAGVKSLINIAFADTHPTGHFYKTDIYKTSKNVKKIIENLDQFGFYFEIINAGISLIGPSVILNSIYFETETNEERKKVLSKSFLGKDNFFDPLACKIRFCRYYNELFSLKLNYFIKQLVTVKLFYNYVISSVFAYKSILSNKDLCDHYCVESYSLSKKDLFSILLGTNKTLLTLNKLNIILILPFVIIINLYSLFRIVKI